MRCRLVTRKPLDICLAARSEIKTGLQQQSVHIVYTFWSGHQFSWTGRFCGTCSLTASTGENSVWISPGALWKVRVLRLSSIFVRLTWMIRYGYFVVWISFHHLGFWFDSLSDKQQLFHLRWCPYYWSYLHSHPQLWRRSESIFTTASRNLILLRILGRTEPSGLSSDHCRA